MWRRVAGFLALVLIGAARTAHPQGVALSWNDCYGSPGARQWNVFDCQSDQESFRLVGSFVAPEGVTMLTGMEARIDVFPAGQGLLPDWWHLEDGGCRAGSFSTGVTFPGLTACMDFWAGKGSGGSHYSIVPYPTNPPHPADQGRIGLVYARRLTDAGPLESGRQYYAFRMTLDSRHTTASDPPACDGCAQGVCLLLNYLLLAQPVGLGDFVLTTELNPWSSIAAFRCADYHAHMGGCYAVGCELPAHRPTWGALKSLYR